MCAETSQGLGRPRAQVEEHPELPGEELEQMQRPAQRLHPVGLTSVVADRLHQLATEARSAVDQVEHGRTGRGHRLLEVNGSPKLESPACLRQPRASERVGFRTAGVNSRGGELKEEAAENCREVSERAEEKSRRGSSSPDAHAFLGRQEEGLSPP